MAPKRKGAPAVLERGYKLLEQVITAADAGDKFAIYNPQLSRAKHKEIRALAVDLLKLIKEEFEPHMERAAPPLEKRLDEIERRLEAVENAAPFRVIDGTTPRRKEG